MGEFEYEKLRVYQYALQANADIWALLKTQRRYGSLEKQIERAGESILLNIAEGAGEFSPADKVRFYRIALRSVSETAAGLDLLSHRSPTTASACGAIKEQLRSTAALLMNLIHATKARIQARQVAQHPE